MQMKDNAGTTSFDVPLGTKPFLFEACMPKLVHITPIV